MLTVTLLVITRTVTTGTVKYRYLETVETNASSKTFDKTEDDITQFMSAIGFRESSNNYDTINELGYIGRYQFGTLALTDIGISPSEYENFRYCPEMQDQAFIALCAINKYRLRKYIAYYKNRVCNGIKITESGLLAAAHLLGSNNVKKYLKNDPTANTTDYYGTSLEEYLQLFSDYDLSAIDGRRIVKL